MQISYSNSLTFNANIKFVDSMKYARKALGDYFYCAHPEASLLESMIVAKNFCTSEVKSCTSGGIVGLEEAIGFHFYDCKQNIKKIAKNFVKTVKEKMAEPVSALIIGSKNIPNAPNSVPVFETVETQAKKIVKPSIFKTYSVKYSEADIAYEKATDTWFINATYPKNPMMPREKVEIKSVEDLKSMFESIKIAPQDKLFIDETEVLASEYPELFL